jgi:hypothetical protein
MFIAFSCATSAAQLAIAQLAVQPVFICRVMQRIVRMICLPALRQIQPNAATVTDDC